MRNALVKVVHPWIFMITMPLGQKNVVYCCNAWTGGVRHLQDRNLIHLLTLEYSFHHCCPFPISKWKKSNSTNVVFENVVTIPSQNCRNRLKGTLILSHASLKDTVCLYELMIYLMCWSLLYCLIRLRCSTSILLFRLEVIKMRPIHV